MKPNQKLEHNVEPTAERPEEASPRTNTYLCCVNGEANSLTDLSQVSISTERKAVWSLLRAVEGGLRFDGVSKAKIEETQKYIDEVKERCKSRAGRQDSAADPKPGEQWQLGE
ncbi:hypothetical protein APSETT444_008770 [Aspergillus pseudonomiae]